MTSVAHGGVKGARWSAAVVCMAAALGLATAATASAQPLAWSAPVLVDTQTPFSATNEVDSMSCVSTSLCIVGSFGKIVTSIDPTDAATAKWTIKGILPERDTIVGMSCPSTLLCVGVDDQGDTVTSTDPGDGPTATWSTEFGADTTKNVANTLTSISCPSTSLCVAVDENGNVMSTTDPRDGATAVWTVDNVDGTGFISDVSCASSSLCVAVDREGNVLASTDPGDGASATWTLTDADGSTRLNAIYCFPSGASCIAGDESGNTLTSTDPGSMTPTWTPESVDGKNGLKQISCSSTSVCVAIDTNLDAVVTTDAGDGASAMWSVKSLETGGLFQFLVSVSCVTSMCVVGDDVGRTLTSNDPADGALATWTRETGVVGENRIEASSCPSSTLCVAVDSQGNSFTTADPADGANAIWAVDAGIAGGKISLNGVSCPSTGLCVAVSSNGDVLATTDPAAGASAPWASEDVDGTNIIDAVSCASASLCVAVDDDGNVLESANAGMGSTATWTTLDVDGTGTLTSVSCTATPELCVAGDNAGNVISSTNPDQGAGATWASQNADGGLTLNGMSCLGSPEMCFGADSNGDILASSDPQHGATALWHVIGNDASDALDGISCLPTLCAAVDTGGNVLTSTDPTASSSTWVLTSSVDSNNAINTVSCPSDELCVAGDAVGNLQSGVGQVLTVTTAGTGSGTVASVPGGISCPTTCSATFAPGTKITLSARPATGSAFAGWSGGACSGTGLCQVTLGADQSVTATFTTKNTLTVTDAGAGTGTVTSAPQGISCPTTCSSGFAAGSMVTLTASPSAGSTFAGWSGGGCSGTGACAVTMSSDLSVTATFGLPPALTVTVGGSGSGRVTSSPTGISCPGTCSSSFAPGTKVTLTATASSGSTFSGWSGACSGTGGCVLTMTGSLNVTASFGTSMTTTTTGTSPPPPPPKPPSCTLDPAGNRVAVKAGKAHRHLKPRTLEVTITCNQSAQVKLTGKVTSVPNAKKGKKPPKAKTFGIRAVTAQASAGKELKLTVQLPAAALKHGSHDSASFTLTATNANGSGTAGAKIRKLVLV